MSAPAATLIALPGLTERLDWVRERLDRQGLAAMRVTAPPIGDATLLIGDAAGWDWLCTAPPASGSYCFIDVSGDWFGQIAARAAQAAAIRCTYLELAGPWHPCGATLGFGLAVGTDAPDAIDTCRPLLDALAPAAGLFATVGRAGAASFSYGIAEAVRHLWLSQLAPWSTLSPETLDIAHWVDRLRQHDAQLEPLLAAAQCWRRLSPPGEEPPPFADALADWLLACLPLASETDRQFATWLQQAADRNAQSA